MTHPVALLVDGDNIGARNAAALLGIARDLGDPVVVRAYLDAQRATDWHNAAGYRLIHAGTGKNASDILLAIDAMDLLHAGVARHVVIATSDGDFTHLALRLREHGAKVLGVGEAKGPPLFRASCTSFIELGAPVAMRVVPTSPAGVSDLDVKIRAMIARHSQRGEGMRIAVLAQKMHLEHGIRIGTLPEKTWRKYLTSRPALFDVAPRGPDATVRFRPEGFAAAA